MALSWAFAAAEEPGGSQRGREMGAGRTQAVIGSWDDDKYMCSPSAAWPHGAALVICLRAHRGNHIFSRASSRNRPAGQWLQVVL